VQETEDIIGQLIAAKMDNATYSYELDEHKRKSAQLKRRVQTLAERVAVLEVAAAEAYEAAPSLPPPSPVMAKDILI
jgi:hypothetical protein